MTQGELFRPLVREPMVRMAVISDDERYRYGLTRSWHLSGRSMLFVMLNPSTADGRVDDPTIRRCIGYARREGCETLHVVNLYAWRATKPADLWAAQLDGHDIIGPENDQAIREYASRSQLIVAAWGSHDVAARARQVVELLPGPVHCLGTTKHGHPRHPLYVRGDAPLIPFEERDPC